MSGGINGPGSSDTQIHEAGEAEEAGTAAAGGAAEGAADAGGAAEAAPPPHPAASGAYPAVLAAQIMDRLAPRERLGALFDQAKAALGAPRLPAGPGTNEKGYKIISREQQIAGTARDTVASQVDEETRKDFDFVKAQLTKGKNAVNIFGSADGHVFGCEEEGTLSRFMHDNSSLMARTAIVHDFLTAVLEPGTSGVDLMPVAVKIAHEYEAAGSDEKGWEIVNKRLYAVLSDPDHYKVKSWVKNGLD
jgi:hypothetical protein